MSSHDRARMPARPLRLRKLPARYAGFVTPLILSGLMTFIVSAIATGKGIGLGPDFARTWMEAWGVSWVIAFPTLLLVLPVVRRIVGLLVETPDHT